MARLNVEIELEFTMLLSQSQMYSLSLIILRIFEFSMLLAFDFNGEHELSFNSLLILNRVVTIIGNIDVSIFVHGYSNS